VLSEPRWLTNGLQFRLVGEFGEAYLIEGSGDLINWTPVRISMERQSARTVVAPATGSVQVYRAKLMRGFGIRAVSRFDLKGHAFESDSFDSSDPLFSTGGQYDPAKRLDGGNVGVYAALTNAGGNVQIRGKLYMGPDGQTSGLGPQGSIGSGMWVGSGTTGIQPGYLRTNLPPSFANAPPAPLGGYVPSAGSVGGVYYDYVLPNGIYQINAANLSNKKTLVVGDAWVYFPQGLVLSGSAAIQLVPDSSLMVWSGGPVQLGGQGVAGVTRADQFAIFGLPSCTNVSVSVNSTFVGVIYAPSARCAIGPMTFIGSCFAESVVLTGAVSLHFDEVMKSVGEFW
jgi:hypothetical protein